MSTKLTMKGRVLFGCVCVNNSQQINRTDLVLAHSLYIQHQEKSNKNLFRIKSAKIIIRICSIIVINKCLENEQF